MKIKLLFTCCIFSYAFYFNGNALNPTVSSDDAFDCPETGDSCDDGDALTLYDTVDADCNCVGIPVTGTLEYPIRMGSDDAEENKSDGSVGLSSSDIEIGMDNSTAQLSGLRFDDVQIPKNALITSAFIQFVIKGTGDVLDTDLTFKGEKVANSATFESVTFNISSRTTTDATGFWDAVPIWTGAEGDAGNDQKTPDMAEIVQEIINLDDWTVLSPITFIIDGTGGREAKSYERVGDGTDTAKLIISYDLSTLSNSDFNKTTFVKVFPNPASNLVSVKSEEILENISMFNILGSRVLSIKPTKKETSLNISQLKSGVYFVHLKQPNNQIETHKLIIQ